jgi:diphthine methyl ester synthase
MQIVAGTMKELLDVDFGPPLHSLIISGELHPIEQQMLQHLQPHRD